MALAAAGPDARGATAYVTLEPCAHHGRTPPCADALIEAGVARVVTAAGDPDPRVAGAGIARLTAAGIAVDTGVEVETATTLNAGFFRRIRDGRPHVILKLATTLDGRIATRTGESRWITGPQARAHGHLLRAQVDAIMVGVGTVIADDPDLTCRLPGLEDRSPVRVVADGRLRTPLTARLVRDAHRVPTWIAAAGSCEAERRKAFEDLGVAVLATDVDDRGMPAATAMLAALGSREITRVLVEGGARLAASLLAADMVDELAWFRAGRIIGGDGRAAVDAFGVDRLDGARGFRRTAVATLGDDTLETFLREP